MRNYGACVGGCVCVCVCVCVRACVRVCVLQGADGASERHGRPRAAGESESAADGRSAVHLATAAGPAFPCHCIIALKLAVKACVSLRRSH
jgi:hypothetical protein